MFKCSCRRMKCDEGSDAWNNLRISHIHVFLKNLRQHVPRKKNMEFAKVRRKNFFLAKMTFSRWKNLEQPSHLSQMIGSSYSYVSLPPESNIFWLGLNFVGWELGDSGDLNSWLLTWFLLIFAHQARVESRNIIDSKVPSSTGYLHLVPMGVYLPEK